MYLLCYNPPPLRYVCLKERNMLLTQLSWEEKKEKTTQIQSQLKHRYVLRYTMVRVTRGG